ncbi:10138_t:CDS:1, partial [Paraglomus occultum]
MKNPNFFLFFALATISVINAIPHGLSKRATPFVGCSYLPPFSVSLSPDSIVSDQDVTFGISGTAPIDITEATVEVIIFNNDDVEGYYQSFSGNLCELFKQCPVKINTKFDFQFTIKPESLPPSYYIDVRIHDTKSNL